MLLLFALFFLAGPPLNNVAYFSYVRWRVWKILRACVSALGRAMRLGGGDEGSGNSGVGGSEETEEEPEVEDVEDAGLLPPVRLLHDYDRVETTLARWHEEDDNRLGKLPAGLTNSGNTCFAASALQCLYHTRLFTAHFSEQPHEGCSTRGFCVTCEYQSHVCRALESEPQSSFSIGKLTSAINKIAKHFVRGRQEDSHDYVRGLLDGIHVQCLKEIGGDKAEKTLDARTQETTMVYHVFGGYTVGRVVCGECGYESRTYQSMIDIPVDLSLRGPLSVEASMRSNFTDTETLDGSNKYKCGRCRAYVKAEKGAKIHVSPNVLVLPLKRYAMGRFSKITKHVEFPLELDLAPYMSADAPYEGDHPPKYLLYGVIVHLDWMGSAHSGHYISYVRLGDGRWCKCDDGRVEETDETTVLKQKAYLLFYERQKVRGAPPVRTAKRQARVDELKRLAEERTERIKARRAAAAARKETGKKKKSPAGKGKAPAGDGDGDDDDDDDEEEVDQTLTVPEHTVTFVGKQTQAGKPSRLTAKTVDPSSSSDDNASDSSDGGASDTKKRVAGVDDDDDDENGDIVLPTTPWPHRVICSVKLPTVSSAREVRVEQSCRELTVTVRRAHRRRAGNVALELAVPYPIDDDASEIQFDSGARVLKVVMPVLPYTPAGAREHGVWLAAWEAEQAKKKEMAALAEAAAATARAEAAAQARARAARLQARAKVHQARFTSKTKKPEKKEEEDGSSSEWVETDGDGEGGGDDDNDDDDDESTEDDHAAGVDEETEDTDDEKGVEGLDDLAADMGLMQVASPNTRAAARRAAAGGEDKNHGKGKEDDDDDDDDDDDNEEEEEEKEEEPLVNILDRRDRATGLGEIEVTVDIPGVKSATEVEAELSTTEITTKTAAAAAAVGGGGSVKSDGGVKGAGTREVTVLHVRVPGRYRADVTLPVRTTGPDCPGKLNRRTGKIVFTLPVNEHKRGRQ